MKRGANENPKVRLASIKLKSSDSVGLRVCQWIKDPARTSEHALLQYRHFTYAYQHGT